MGRSEAALNSQTAETGQRGKHQRKNLEAKAKRSLKGEVNLILFSVLWKKCANQRDPPPPRPLREGPKGPIVGITEVHAGKPLLYKCGK